MNSQIYIGDLKETMTEKEVLDYFSKFGEIKEVKLHGKYGFVTAEQSVVEHILEEDTHYIEGEQVKLEMARGKSASSDLCRSCNKKISTDRCSRLIIENVPKTIDANELSAFVLAKGVENLKAQPDKSVKILTSGDAMVEFRDRASRDEAIERLNGQELDGEIIIARVGRRRQRNDDRDDRHDRNDRRGGYHA